MQHSCRFVLLLLIATLPLLGVAVAAAAAGSPEAAPLAGKPGWVGGSVVYDDKPVPNLRVRLCKGAGGLMPCELVAQTKTDVAGKYTLANVKPGHYHLAIDTFDPKRILIPNGPETVSIGGMFKLLDGGRVDLGASVLHKEDLKLLAPLANALVKEARPKVQWAPYPGVTKYEIKLRRKHPAGLFKPQSWETMDTQTVSPIDLPNGPFEFSVAGLNASGKKITSTRGDVEFRVTGQADMLVVKLLAPKNASERKASGPIEFMWTPVAGATDYLLSLHNMKSKKVVSYFTTETHFKLDGPHEPAHYYFHVQARKEKLPIAVAESNGFYVK
jgi:hypothetical protein